jgi:hypothetical protein
MPMLCASCKSAQHGAETSFGFLSFTRVVGGAWCVAERISLLTFGSKAACVDDDKDTREAHRSVIALNFPAEYELPQYLTYSFGLII